MTDAELETFYENWVAYVKSTVPAEKLLIFNAKDGMEPLARFCDKPAPSMKMPHANVGGQFNLRKKVMERIAQATILGKNFKIFKIDASSIAPSSSSRTSC